MAASTSREVRVLDNFAKQETGKQTTLDFQKPPVADAITKQRMRNILRKSALEGGNETLAPVLAQVDASRSADEIRRPNLAVVDRLNDRRISQQWPEWFHHVERQRRTPIARLVIKASIRIRSEEHTSELQSLMRISYAVF